MPDRYAIAIPMPDRRHISKIELFECIPAPEGLELILYGDSREEVAIYLRNLQRHLEKAIAKAGAV